MATRKIVQIMPAAGWGAAFDAGEEEEISPLVAWALVHDGTKSAVVGLVAGNEVELCDEADNFAGYVYLSDVLTDGLELEGDLEDELDEVDQVELEDDSEDDDGDDDDFNAAPDDGPAYDPTAGLLN